MLSLSNHREIMLCLFCQCGTEHTVEIIFEKKVHWALMIYRNLQDDLQEQVPTCICCGVECGTKKTQ